RAPRPVPAGRFLSCKIPAGEETGMATAIQISGPDTSARERVLTPEALDFVAELQDHLGAAREDLLRQRVLRQEDLSRGIPLEFLDHTQSIREADWQVAPAPPDLEDRRVEITGPVERKMMINAFNSGASVFMADFEDALAPTWQNVVE